LRAVNRKSFSSVTSKFRETGGWAAEYVDAMHRMLQLDTPEDFVIATGETRKLEDFVSAANTLA
jgi:GDP-D-mannose dehydratase